MNPFDLDDLLRELAELASAARLTCEEAVSRLEGFTVREDPDQLGYHYSGPTESELLCEQIWAAS